MLGYTKYTLKLKTEFSYLFIHRIKVPRFDHDDDDNVLWFNVHLKADWKPA